jgi:hypothetical protein
MNLDTFIAEWAERCRRLARLARDDAERSATYAALNPDETLRVVREDPGAQQHKS